MCCPVKERIKSAGCRASKMALCREDRRIQGGLGRTTRDLPCCVIWHEANFLGGVEGIEGQVLVPVLKTKQLSSVTCSG